MKTISILLLLACICPVYAELIIIEADEYDVGGATRIDLSPFFPEFDFIACGSYSTIYARESITGYGQLGENVLGCAVDDYWTYPAQLHIKIIDGMAKHVSLLVHESTESTSTAYVWLRVLDTGNMLLEETYVQAPNTDHPPAILSITRDDYDIARIEIRLGGGGDSICLDHIEILLNPKQILTVQTEPNFIDTTDPNCGEHICHLNDVMDLSASDYTACPDTWKFDHWMGDVNDPCSANTTIVMDSNEIVTACFVPVYECGDTCHPVSQYDYNADCYVDFEDFSEFANNWLFCNHPDCD